MNILARDTKKLTITKEYNWRHKEQENISVYCMPMYGKRMICIFLFLVKRTNEQLNGAWVFTDGDVYMDAFKHA